MIAYSNIAPLTGLLPQTIERSSYVYLNYTNDTEQTVVEYINGDIAYYHFPINFLIKNKNLLYNNGGSTVYR